MFETQANSQAMFQQLTLVLSTDTYTPLSPSSDRSSSNVTTPQHREKQSERLGPMCYYGDMMCGWQLFCRTNGWTIHDPAGFLLPTRSPFRMSHRCMKTEMKGSGSQSTLEVVRWCSWASGRRNGQSCWIEHSSPPRSVAAGRPRPPTGAGRAGEAARPRRPAAETRT